jgi:hypothetical protein
LSNVFAACSSDVEMDVNTPLEIPQQTPSAYSIQKAKEAASHLFSITAIRGSSDQMGFPYDEATKEIEKKLEYAVINDVYVLLKEQGYREVLADAMYDYAHGASLEELVFQYQITETELPIFANACACIDYINQNQTRGFRRNAVACIIAVASSVACSIGAIGVTTPAGLGGFLVGKALATVSLAMCAS